MDARAWLQTLPDELSMQRDILMRLLERVEHDPRWRWLQLGCSVAEGRGDALSDLDLGLGVVDEAWDSAVADLPALLESIGPVVGALYHRLPEMGARVHLRAFVQYAGGAQIDLVAMPAHTPRGHKREDLVLYDPDRLLGEPWDPDVLQATPDLVYEWTFLGWVALADLVKYLRRGSVWEALERLDQARTHIWRLWAVARGLRYPLFGLTTVMDHPEIPLLPEIEQTTARADDAEIHQAAKIAGALLADISSQAARITGAALPEALAAFVTDRLVNGESRGYAAREPA